MYTVQNYYQPSSTQTPEEILTSISRQIDQATRQVYEDLRFCLWQSPEHLNRVLLICNQPINCGKTITAPVLMQGASAFEQMLAIENWMACYTSQNGPLMHQHSFCLCNHTPRLFGRAVPIIIKKNAINTWNVKLGNNGYLTPAPVYDIGWGRNDPWKSEVTENFIYHLEALEMVRQPDFIGATLIKGNAFESEYIDENWRYGVTDLHGSYRREACVEFKGQNALKSPKAEVKVQSAAFNLLQLIAKGYGHIDLCHHLQGNILDYFDFSEQVPEHLSLRVTPKDIFEALNQKHITNAGRDALYYEMFKLMIAKIGPQSTPDLRRFIVARFRQAPFTITLSR